MPEISVILPHYNTPSATRALNVCLRTLAEHTPIDYELMVIGHKRREYFAYNSMAARAAGDWLVFSCTDMFFAPRWYEWLNDECAHDVARLMTVVEPTISGPVAEQAIGADFGTTPESYDRAGFEAFAATRPIAANVFGWGFPLIVRRQTFLDFGGFPLDNVDANTADIDMLYLWQRAGGSQQRIPYYVYHLKTWTLTGEGR